MFRKVKELAQVAATRNGLSRNTLSDREALRYTNARFDAAYEDPHATPLIIPAKNEGHLHGVLENNSDLPATLLSVARLIGSVLPVVVDNGSEDDTTEIAKAMGASVISAPLGRKAAATQAGLQYAIERGSRNALFSDADALFPRQWGQSMTSKLEHYDQGNGSVVAGTTLYMHKGRVRPLADIAMSSAMVAQTILARARSQTPPLHGINYGLRFDSAGQIEQAVNSVDPDAFRHDDLILRQKLWRETDAAMVKTLDPASMIITANDRIHTFSDTYRVLTQGARGYDDTAEASYQEQYGSDGY